MVDTLAIYHWLLCIFWIQRMLCMMRFDVEAPMRRELQGEGGRLVSGGDYLWLVVTDASSAFWTALYSPDQNQQNRSSLVGFISLWPMPANQLRLQSRAKSCLLPIGGCQRSL